MRKPRTAVIHPELFIDEALGYCSPGARLYFVYLWMHSEDDGTISTHDVSESHLEWPEMFAQELASVRRLIQTGPATIKLVNRDPSPGSRRMLSHRPHKERNARRRARKIGASINDFTAIQWAELVISERGECAYCHKPAAKLVQEHMVPLARGGDHTLSNIAPSCGPCNSRKGVKTPLEFVFGVNVGRRSHATP